MFSKNEIKRLKSSYKYFPIWNLLFHTWVIAIKFAETSLGSWQKQWPAAGARISDSLRQVSVYSNVQLYVQGGETGIGVGEACNRDILPLCTSYSSRTTTTVSTINHNRCRTKSEEVTMPRDILDQSQRSANLSLWPVIATARASNRLVQE